MRPAFLGDRKVVSRPGPDGEQYLDLEYMYSHAETAPKATLQVVLSNGHDKPGIESISHANPRSGHEEMWWGNIEFFWPCTHVGPDTEEGYGEQCGTPCEEKDGYCDYHALTEGKLAGCVLCMRVGDEFATDEHGQACIKEYDEFNAEFERTYKPDDGIKFG